MIVYIPLIVALIGLLIFALTNGKAAEAGKLAYFAGLLVTLLGLAGRVVGKL